MIQEPLLTKENVGFYLFLRDFLSINEFSKECYTVKVLVARNLSFQLLHKNGKKFFIKQLCHDSAHDKAAFAFEMAFYEACASHPDFAPLAALVPRLYRYDPLYRIAVWELLEGFRPALPLADHWEQALAALLQIAAIPVKNTVNDQRPFLMHLQAWKEEEILRPYLQNPLLEPVLRQLNTAWYPWNILHNDLKPGNILINDRKEVKIIDWEKMSTGDALWDLAALIFYTLPYDSAVYQAPVASAAYLTAQSPLLKQITRAFREQWTEDDALRLTRYLGLQVFTVITVSGRTPSGRVLQLAADLLLNPQPFLNLMFENYG